MTQASADRIPILTIGYGSRSMEEFIAALRRYEIRYVVDVRSAPYSRYKPEFSKEALEQALQRAGIRYLFMGDTLGGRPDDLDCYDAEGKVDYETVKGKAFYQAGLDRIGAAYEQRQHIVLMCSEGRPQDCHRSKLIGVSLDEAGIEVQHIDEGDELKSQEQVLVIARPQPSLFDGFDTFTSKKKYVRPGEPSPEDEDPDIKATEQ